MKGLSENTIRDVVAVTMHTHPPECIFAPNAYENIVAATIRGKTVDEQIDLCEQALIENEIYCPHEGVDRRHLYPGYENASTS